MTLKMHTRDYFGLDAKVAFVPGGYGDLGKAIAYGLCEKGATVVVAGRSLQKAQSLADEIREEGGDASAVGLDVMSVSEIHDGVETVIDRYGAIDILVNCVGIQHEQPILEVSEDAFDEVYQSQSESSDVSGTGRRKASDCGRQGRPAGPPAFRSVDVGVARKGILPTAARKAAW